MKPMIGELDKVLMRVTKAGYSVMFGADTDGRFVIDVGYNGHINQQVFKITDLLQSRHSVITETVNRLCIALRDKSPLTATVEPVMVVEEEVKVEMIEQPKPAHTPISVKEFVGTDPMNVEKDEATLEKIKAREEQEAQAIKTNIEKGKQQ